MRASLFRGWASSLRALQKSHEVISLCPAAINLANHHGGPARASSDGRAYHYPNGATVQKGTDRESHPEQAAVRTIQQMRVCAHRPSEMRTRAVEAQNID
jgi:hypothetical protein